MASGVYEGLSLMPGIVDLRSDFLTRPTAAMCSAMLSAAQAPAQFGLREDPYQQRLEHRLAELLGAEDALLFPTCTMANEVALQLLTLPGEIVLAPPDAHIVTSEAGGPSAIAGVQVVAVPGTSPCPAVGAWEALARSATDELKPRVAALVLENTHNRAGGYVVPLAYVSEVLAVARSAGLRAHLDGARLFNAAVALGVEPRALCAGFDTIALSLNKALGAPIGAALAGSRMLIQRALTLRQRLGGGIRPTGILAAAALEGLADYGHLAADHARARVLAFGLTGVHGLRVDTEAVHTNIVLVDLIAGDRTAQDLCDSLQREGLRVLPFGAHRVRLVVYRDITDADIATAIAAFHAVLQRP